MSKYNNRTSLGVTIELHERLSKTARELDVTISALGDMALSYALDHLQLIEPKQFEVNPPPFAVADLSQHIGARAAYKHGRRRDEPDELDWAMSKRYAEGIGYLTVAGEFKTSGDRVKRALERTGTPMRTDGNRGGIVRQQDKKRIEMIRHMKLEERLNMEDIAGRLGITRERVRQLCVKNGISTERLLTHAQEAVVMDYVNNPDYALDFVAAKHGTTQHTLRQWIEKAGYTLRPRSPKHDPAVLRRAKRVADLYRAGMKIKDIAKVVGLNHAELVYRDLSYMGVERDRLPCKKRRKVKVVRKTTGKEVGYWNSTKEKEEANGSDAVRSSAAQG